MVKWQASANSKQLNKPKKSTIRDSASVFLERYKWLSSPLLWGIIILLISFSLRVYHLGAIPDQIFDEVYFPVFAHDYITHTDFFDAHPPLGKLIISLGIRSFGNNPFGWRIMNAFAGVLLLGCIAGFAYSLTKNKRLSLIALLLVAVDPIALVESRVGLINIYLALFSIIGLWFFWRWWSETPQKTWYLAVSFLAIGMATAVKWIGIGALGAIILFLIIQKLLGKKVGISFRHIVLLLLIPLIYFIIFLPDLLMRPTTGWWQYLTWWHTSAFEYHAHLNATHPYGSNWWTWAITLRPVWMYYKSLDNGYIQGIIEVGNVVTWIGGLIALFFVIASLRTRAILKKNDAYLFLILTYAALYLPWTLISRVKFIYHYFVPLLMLLIILACVIEEAFLQDKENQWFGWAFLIFAAAVFIYFLPLVLGIPITQSAYLHHLWFGKHWI